MLRRKLSLIACLSLLGAAAAVAQPAGESGESPRAEAADQIEVTLFLGLLISDSLDSDGPGAKVDFDDDLGLGFIVGLPCPYGFRAELIYGRNEMELTADRPGQPRLTRVDQEYVHIGGLWELGDGREGGFATASVGMTRLEPEGFVYSSETLPSFGLGGGGKFFYGDNVGFRFEGRLLGHIGGGSKFCNENVGCLGRTSGSMLMQFHAAAGLTVRF